MRLVLGVEYDGSSFCGWQIQPNAPTVQGEIEKGLGQIAAEPIRVFCAGRTDTGVHAAYQVVHFETGSSRPLTAWVRGVNALISRDISVLWAVEVCDEFHARYSAKRRTYRYLLMNRDQRPGLLKDKVGWYHKTLNIDSMISAARFLLGRHDFSSFRSSECQAKSPIRTVDSLAIKEDAGLIIFDITANAFLHHMVRNIIGALVYIGAGKQGAGWMKELLEARDRNIAAPTFDPNGLYLTSVEYDAKWNLPGASVFSGPSGRIISTST